MSTKHFFVYTLALGLAISLAAATVPPEPQGFKLNGDPARGKATFDRSCALCHGRAGKGNGDMAPGLNPKPQDLTDRTVMAKRSDWEIYLVIRDGGQTLGLSPQMYSFKNLLQDQQIRDVAAYVRSLARPAK
ncbi:MAG TPA: cytochrome c [Thermoanaerobaculia bacterium]|nr:cytochrome c [Thermoanaerobaculia bacterium]